MNGVVRNVRQTPLYLQANLEEQAELIIMMMKLQNQSENLWAPRLVRNVVNGQYQNVADVSRAIDGLRPPAGGSKQAPVRRQARRRYAASRRATPSTTPRIWSTVALSPWCDISSWRRARVMAT